MTIIIHGSRRQSLISTGGRGLSNNKGPKPNPGGGGSGGGGGTSGVLWAILLMGKENHESPS